MPARFTPETYKRLKTYKSLNCDLSAATVTQAVPLFFARDHAEVIHSLQVYVNEAGSGALDDANIEVGTAADPNAYGEIGAAALDALSANGVGAMTINEDDIPANTPVLVKVTQDASQAGEFTVMAEIGVSSQD